jgi:hypothetical protein
MSLIICANQESDSKLVSKANSINKAFSFRNALSNTIDIPKNAQVALQSCKINLDGSIITGGNNQVFFQYFGEELDVGETMNNSTAIPIRTELLGAQTKSENLTTSQFAIAIKNAMNDTMSHPNMAGLCDCEVKRNTTNNEFEGYTLIYETYIGTGDDYSEDMTFVGGGAMESRYDETDDYTKFANNIGPNWDYTPGTGVFATNASFTETESDVYSAVAICNSHPISLYNGSLEVLFANANDGGMNWAVGLSRFNTEFGADPKAGAPGWLTPSYYSENRGDESQSWFMDYFVERSGDYLWLNHTIINPDETDGVYPGEENYLMTDSIEYWGAGTSSSFTAQYDLAQNASALTNVVYATTGESMKIELTTAGGLDRFTLYEYDSSSASRSKTLKPISQPTWNLHPALYIQTTNASNTHSMTIGGHQASPITGYDPEQSYSITNAKDGKMPWWNCIEEYSPDNSVAWGLEQRSWNNYSPNETSIHTQAGLISGSRTRIDLAPIMILKENSVYTPTFGANTAQILGFTSDSLIAPGTVEFDAVTGATSASISYSSVDIPKSLSNKSLFVRLHNFTTQSMNALQSNKTSIIAHLPMFDSGQTETGRMFYEPNTLVFLDLNNPSAMKVNQLDISFCYINERYAEALVGQSIVGLYIREKGSNNNC